jgi:hypothetical protein
VTGLRVGRSGFRILARGTNLSVIQNRPEQLRGDPSLLSRYRGSLLGLRQPEREVAHSPPSTADGKSESSCTVLLPCIP